jgi:hypothetical protein
MLLYLLLGIPPERRVSVSQGGRLGIGIVHARSQSVAIVSVRSPWSTNANERNGRARWRLDAYGNDAAAGELGQLLDEWRELKRAGRTKLQITAQGRNTALRLSFAWVRSYA